MQVNLSKCRVLSVGRGYPHSRYTLSHEELVGSEDERDLEVIVNSDLCLRKHCIETRNKANKVLGFILRSVKSVSPDVILKLYLARCVRHHLDQPCATCGPQRLSLLPFLLEISYSAVLPVLIKSVTN